MSQHIFCLTSAATLIKLESKKGKHDQHRTFSFLNGVYYGNTIKKNFEQVTFIQGDMVNCFKQLC